MESEFRTLELASFETDWLRNFIADIPSTKDRLPLMSINCDYQAAIAIIKNKSYNCKSRHMKLRYDIINQLFKDVIIFIDFVMWMCFIYHFSTVLLLFHFIIYF